LRQKRTLPIKTTNDQNENFEETDFGKKLTKPTKPRQFYKLNSPEPLQKKDKPILKTYTTDQEQSRSHEIKPIKTDADQKCKLKTLKPILETRQNQPETLPIKRKLVEKNENLKTCKLKTRLKYRFEKCHR